MKLKGLAMSAAPQHSPVRGLYELHIDGALESGATASHDGTKWRHVECRRHPIKWQAYLGMNGETTILIYEYP